MAVKIRLRRVGAKKQPSYRVVVADSRSPRDGRFIEVIGFYNPRTKPTTIQIDEEKARKWLGNGALPTESVASLLFRAGIVDLRAPRWRKEGDTLTRPAAATEATSATTATEATSATTATEATSATIATVAPAALVTPSVTEQAPAAEAEQAPTAPTTVAEQAPTAPAAVAEAAAPTEQTADGGPQPLPGEDSGALVADADAATGADTATAS